MEMGILLRNFKNLRIKILLDSISNPLNQKVSFSYNAETENDFPTDSLITKILYPTATSVTIKYLKGGLNTCVRCFFSCG